MGQDYIHCQFYSGQKLLLSQLLFLHRIADLPDTTGGLCALLTLLGSAHMRLSTARQK